MRSLITQRTLRFIATSTTAVLASLLLTACASAPTPVPTPPAPEPAPTPDHRASGILLYNGPGSPDPSKVGWQLMKDGITSLDLDVKEVASNAPALVGKRVKIASQQRANAKLRVLTMTADAALDGIEVQGILRAAPTPKDPESQAPRWFLAMDDGRLIDATIAKSVLEERISTMANTRVVARADYGTQTAYKADNWTGLTITQLNKAETPKDHRDLEGVLIQDEEGNWVLVNDALETTPIDVDGIKDSVELPKVAAQTEATKTKKTKAKSVLLNTKPQEEAQAQEPSFQRYGILAEVDATGGLVAKAAHAIREPGRSAGVRVEGTFKRVHGKWKVIANDGRQIDLDLAKVGLRNIWKLRGKAVLATGVPI
ncbi:MAG: hypothetical protein AAFX99_23200, partial [Myxococcota bacterium]